MAEIFRVTCHCGGDIDVELHQAGTDLDCPYCRSLVAVPRASVLRQLSGDRNPFANSLDKIAKALENSESPFDGICQHCKKAPATNSTPVMMRVFVERDIGDGGGVAITPFSISVSLAESRTFSRQLKFPLLLCNKCQEASTPPRMSIMTMIAIAATLVIMGILGLLFFLVLPIFGLFVLAVPLHFAMASTQSNSKVRAQLEKVQYVGDIVRRENECMIQSGPTKPYQAPKPIKASEEEPVEVFPE